MSTQMIQYTFKNINEMKLNNEYNLNQDTINIIIELEKILGLENLNDKIPLKRSDRSFDRKNKKRGFKRGNSFNDMDIDSWEAMRNFKPTEKVELSVFEKSFNELRSDLNKLSKAKYDEIKSQIIEKIVNIINENEEKQQEVGDMIFNICSGNKFLSELYADLYVELVGQFDMFGNILDNYIVRFKDSLTNIKFIDPDHDYDGFCEYNRLNDERKSHSIFLINLMKQDMISKQSIIDLIQYLQNISFQYIDEEDKTHEVEEITENIFLLITTAKDILIDSDEWVNIKNNISIFASQKAKEHISLSSRCVFKYMDINEKC
jgi:hypothetical protein